MRRILALTLCLALLCPAALAEVFVVSYDYSDEHAGYALLLRDDGTALTPPGTYSSIYELTPEGTPEDQRRFSAMTITPIEALNGASIEDMSYEESMPFYNVALMDAEGTPLTGFDYDSLQWADGAVLFEVYDGDASLYGAMDTDGRVIVPANYVSLRPMGEGYWLALVQDDDSASRCSVHILRPDGTDLDCDMHTGSAYLPEGSGGPGAVLSVEEFGKQSLFLDTEGRVCFGRTFDEVEPFNGAYAAVTVSEKTGLIDRHGTLVVPMQYDYISYQGAAPNDVYIAYLGSALTLYSAQTGEMLMSADFAPEEYVSPTLYSDVLLWIYAGGNNYCYRTDGTLLAAFADRQNVDVSYVQCNADAPRFIESVGEWPDNVSRMIDVHGSPVSRDYLGLTEALWRNGQGRYVISACRMIQGECDETNIDWRSYRYGIVDQDDRLLLPAVYSNYIQVLSPDRYWVSDGSRTGMIDSAGKWIYAIDEYAWLMD